MHNILARPAQLELDLNLFFGTFMFLLFQGCVSLCRMKHCICAQLLLLGRRAWLQRLAAGASRAGSG